jgi:hypothetical protein
MMEEVTEVDDPFLEEILLLAMSDKKTQVINTNIMLLDIIHRPVLIQKHRPVCFSKQRFGDWILSPSSGKIYSVGPNR